MIYVAGKEAGRRALSPATAIVVQNHSDGGVLPPGFRNESNDARILSVAMHLAAEGRPGGAGAGGSYSPQPTLVLVRARREAWVRGHVQVIDDAVSAAISFRSLNPDSFS